jgi:hypothetical protein
LGDLCLIDAFQPFLEQVLVIISRLVEMYVDLIVIAFLLCHGSLAMKNKDQLKRRTAVCHDIKDNSGLSLVPAIAFEFASYRFCSFEIIRITAKKFK